MEPKTAVSEKFFIVKRGKSRKGCIGRVEAETPHGEMIGLLYSGGSNAGTPKKGAVLKKEDTHPLTRHQAQLLLFVSSPSKRLELLCSPQLFLAICGLSQDDLVVVKHRKGYLPGLVKNLMQVVKKECKEDLHMLAFEVEFLEGDGDHKVSPMKPPLPLFSAADIIQVVPANSVPLGLHWRDGKGEGLNRKAVTRVKSMPSVGCHARQITETHTQPRVIQNRQLSISHAPLEVGSMVEVASNSGIIVYGVIRWLGTPGGQTDEWAGIELDYEVNGCSDGIHKDQRYFTCKGNRALFIPITKCSPDSRFVCSSTERETLKPIKTPPVPLYEDSGEDAPPVPETEALPLLVGRMKGIQGHINSCYLDATLFSLFSSSAAVDCICRKLADTERPITCTLRAIVNRLRRQGFVPAESVMNLRKQLGCDTFRKDEKDPEEFITVLFQKVLCMEPLLKLRRGISQGAYTLQIFLEKEQIRQMPTVQQLLDTSCLSADLKFETMPSCLIIQMPRFGNKYKMFPHIIPSVELDVTDLLYSSPRECFICGHLAEFECLQCLPDRKLQPGRIKQFCTTCCTQMHRHPARCGHSPRALTVPADVAADAPAAKRSMQLFAVLCIQTSHYVSFVKYGPAPHSWLFFDSMADRCGDDQSGYNIPEIRACPELGDFLCQSEEELVRANPSQTPELVRRLLCDSYMFLYHNPATALSNPNNGEP